MNQITPKIFHYFQMYIKPKSRLGSLFTWDWQHAPLELALIGAAPLWQWDQTCPRFTGWLLASLLPPVLQHTRLRVQKSGCSLSSLGLHFPSSGMCGVGSQQATRLFAIPKTNCPFFGDGGTFSIKG